MRQTLFIIGFLALAQPMFAGDCTRTLTINVLDQKTGMSVAVDPAALRARVGEVEFSITRLEKVQHRRVLVLVDESTSMAHNNGSGTFQKDALDAVDETLGKLLEELP